MFQCYHYLHKHKRFLVRKTLTQVVWQTTTNWPMLSSSWWGQSLLTSDHHQMLQKCLHCHHQRVLFCLLLLLPLPLHRVLSIHSTGDPVSDTIRKLYPHRAASPLSFLKGIIARCSIYRPVSVCVFRYHSSEIAPSKRAPGAREAPDDSALTRMSTSTRSDSPTNDHHTEYRMKFPYAQK